jgi:hypothetical protein
MRKAKVKIVAVVEREGVPCWPCIDHDYSKELSRVTDVVIGQNPDMDFDIAVYNHVSQAEADYDADLKKYDGVLVLLLTCWKCIDVFYARQSKGGIPTIIADVPFCGSGAVLCNAIPTVRDEKLCAVVLSTLDYSEIARAVRAFNVIAKMKQTTILVIKGTDNELNRRDWEDSFESFWGCKFIDKRGGDLLDYFAKADEKEAEDIAARWVREADDVREPTDADLFESARLHVAIRNMMTDVSADAVAVDCLALSYTGAYGEGRHMYPCLSHYEMLNRGTVAVCESDVSATVTSLIIKYLTGRTGFVSDPVIDTSSDQIIYAHCVGCTKMYGPDDSRRCRFSIRSHAEDKLGASVQIYFPAGEDLTTVMVYPEGEGPAVIHSSKSVGNVGFEESCRSKLVGVGNVEAILNNWNGSWHRTTMFGDYRKAFMQLFKLLGIKVVEEDKE